MSRKKINRVLKKVQRAVKSGRLYVGFMGPQERPIIDQLKVDDNYPSEPGQEIARGQIGFGAGIKYYQGEGL